jgi:hypothetical protein
MHKNYQHTPFIYHEYLSQYENPNDDVGDVVEIANTTMQGNSGAEMQVYFYLFSSLQFNSTNYKNFRKSRRKTSDGTPIDLGNEGGWDDDTEKCG